MTTFQLYSINVDSEGDLQGTINCQYGGPGGPEWSHEICFLTKEQRLNSIDYGWKIPDIEKIFPQVEKALQVFSETVKEKIMARRNGRMN